MKKRSQYLSDILLQNLSAEDLYFECLRFGLPVRINDDRETLEIYLRSVLINEFDSSLDEKIVELTNIKFSRSIRTKIFFRNLLIRIKGFTKI